MPVPSTVVKAIAEGTIRWEKDPDFGYLVATEVAGRPARDPEFSSAASKRAFPREGELEGVGERDERSRLPC